MNRATWLVISGIVTTTFILQNCAPSYPQGERVYQRYCANCHMEDGSGIGALYPSIKQSPYLSSQISSLPCLIRYGRKSTHLTTVYMPEHKMISDVDMANLVNYLTASWGDNHAMNIDEVRAALIECP